MLVAKLSSYSPPFSCTFENYVNYAGSKTKLIQAQSRSKFENYVNYAGSKTYFIIPHKETPFENYVNYAGSKTQSSAPS